MLAPAWTSNRTTDLLLIRIALDDDDFFADGARLRCCRMTHPLAGETSETHNAGANAGCVRAQIDR